MTSFSVGIQMTANSTAIARARIAQIDRVNADPVKLRRDLDDALTTIERQAEMIKELRARLAAYEDDAPPPLPAATALYKGRPYIPAAAAAKGTRLSTATVNRYLNSGFWQGDRPEGYHWIVYTDQPLTPKHSKSSRR